MTKSQRKAANKARHRSADCNELMRNTTRTRIAHVWLNQAAKARRAGDKYGCTLFVMRARNEIGTWSASERPL